MARTSVNNRFLIRDSGQCAFFNGTSSVVSVPNNASLVNADYIAMMLWLRPGTTHPSFMTPIAKSNEYWIETGGTANSYIMHAFFNVDGVDRDSGFTTLRLIPNRRNTIIADYSQASRTIRIFVNGTLNVSNTLTGLNTYALRTNGTGAIYVGNRNTFTRHYQGDMDNAVVLAGGTPLTQTDVNNFHYKGVVPSNAALNLKFDGNVNDSSGLGNNGTATDVVYSDNKFFSLRTAATGRIVASGRVAI